MPRLLRVTRTKYSQARSHACASWGGTATSPALASIGVRVTQAPAGSPVQSMIVSASVRAMSPTATATRFAKDRIYGCEENGPVASLAFVNMYFRGDGKHNLRNTSCFETRLVGASAAAPRARFKDGEELARREHAVVTKVMMNPPFALKRDDEHEYRFVDHALKQAQERALVFTVLPSSVMFASENQVVEGDAPRIQHIAGRRSLSRRPLLSRRGRDRRCLLARRRTTWHGRDALDPS